jgi:excinuclease ABC subunit A
MYLGPEGGDGGWRIVGTGTPEQIAANPESHTGRFLAPLLAPAKPARARKKAVA